MTLCKWWDVSGYWQWAGSIEIYLFVLMEKTWSNANYAYSLIVYRTYSLRSMRFESCSALTYPFNLFLRQEMRVMDWFQGVNTVSDCNSGDMWIWSWWAGCLLSQVSCYYLKNLYRLVCYHIERPHCEHRRFPRVAEKLKEVLHPRFHSSTVSSLWNFI